MESANLLSSDTCYVEFGAGRGTHTKYRLDNELHEEIIMLKPIVFEVQFWCYALWDDYGLRSCSNNIYQGLIEP